MKKETSLSRTVFYSLALATGLMAILFILPRPLSLLPIFGFRFYMVFVLGCGAIAATHKPKTRYDRLSMSLAGLIYLALLAAVIALAVGGLPAF